MQTVSEKELAVIIGIEGHLDEIIKLAQSAIDDEAFDGLAIVDHLSALTAPCYLPDIKEPSKGLYFSHLFDRITRRGIRLREKLAQ